MPDLELSFASGFEAHTFEAIAKELRASGAKVELRRRPPEGPYAFLEWLIPTALILWVAKPYLQEFSKTTGELHAKAFHAGLSRLWSKVFGPKPEVTYNIVSSSGKYKSSVFSAALSLRALRNDNGEVIHLLPMVTSSEDFSLAADRFIQLMQSHYSLEGADGLTKTMPLVKYLNHPNFQALIYMNPETKRLELIDYVESSKAGKLITHPIPE